MKTRQLYIYLDERSNQQIPSRCFRRSRYLGGVFDHLMYPLASARATQVCLLGIADCALSKNKRAIVGRRRCFFGSGEL